MKPGTIVKQFTSTKGHEVIIRYPTSADLDQLLTFVNAIIEEDTFVLLSGKPISHTEEVKFLSETIKKIQANEEVFLVITIEGIISGTAGVRRATLRRGHVGDPGIMIATQYRNQGIGKILFQTLIGEAQKIGIRLLMLCAFENNSKAIHMYESLGFKNVGTVPGALLFKGEYIGEVVMYLPLV